jgi:LysR family transcriptional regulator, glycine cleavage system transcriptional activator
MPDRSFLHALETLELVCRLGSMQKAAARLNVSPPAITRAIRLLEADVGAALMDRSTKPARPTEAGERLARATRNGLALIEDTIADIRDENSSNDRHVTLACTIGMATYWLMPRLPDFYAKHPTITVNVQAPPLDRPVLSRGIDIALRYGTGDWQGETIKLFDERVCPVGRPEVIEQALKDGGLSRAWLIDVRSTAQHWLGWSDYLKASGETCKPEGEVFDNYIHAVQATLDGRGLMLGWKSITADYVNDGTFASWPGGGKDFGTGYFISWSKRGGRKEAAQSFVEWAVDVAREQ